MKIHIMLVKRGGIAGVNALNGIIRNCKNNGNIEGMHGAVGGISGYNADGTVQACYNTGTIEGNHNVGGITGLNGNTTETDSARWGKIFNCYNIGNVSGDAHVGGIAGINYNPNTTINYSYNIGNVDGTSYVGGVCGSIDSNTTISNSYYLDTIASYGIGDTNNADTTATSSNSGAEPKTVADLQPGTAFTDWDTSIWNFVSGKYPSLK